MNEVSNLGHQTRENWDRENWDTIDRNSKSVKGSSRNRSYYFRKSRDLDKIIETCSRKLNVCGEIQFLMLFYSSLFRTTPSIPKLYS